MVTIRRGLDPRAGALSSASAEDMDREGRKEAEGTPGLWEPLRQPWPGIARTHLSKVSLQPEYRGPTLVFLNKGPSCKGEGSE